MIDYVIKCGTPAGTTEKVTVSGYFNALETAQKMAAQNNHCAIIYTYSCDGLKVKNTITPDGRRIKNNG